jgi:hypothetical protein
MLAQPESTNAAQTVIHRIRKKRLIRVNQTIRPAAINRVT